MQRTSVQRVCLAFGIVFVTDEVAEDINDSLVDALLPDPWEAPVLWRRPYYGPSCGKSTHCLVVRRHLIDSQEAPADQSASQGQECLCQNVFRSGRPRHRRDCLPLSLGLTNSREKLFYRSTRRERFCGNWLPGGVHVGSGVSWAARCLGVLWGFWWRIKQ